MQSSKLSPVPTSPMQAVGTANPNTLQIWEPLDQIATIHGSCAGSLEPPNHTYETIPQARTKTLPHGPGAQSLEPINLIQLSPKTSYGARGHPRLQWSSGKSWAHHHGGICTAPQAKTPNWWVGQSWREPRKKQSARINYLREGDTNTKFFHLRASARRRKNFIYMLKHGSAWAITHDEKRPIVQNHFESTMRQPSMRVKDFQWDALRLIARELNTFGNPFTDSEVLNATKQILVDKAPCLDGFTGLFYKVCWPVIRLDMIGWL